MLTGLDHLVILVEELEDAVAGYEELGFTVTSGGEHADGLTRNALVPFADGTYLEIVAFVDSTDERDNVWGWRPFSEAGGGLIDYCVASSDLAADVRRLEEAGFYVDGPDAGGRRLPDGTEIGWKSARVQQDGRVLPFLIEDKTPRALRVPGGPATRHPNGARGISRLSISTREVARTRHTLAALSGVQDETYGNTTFRIGSHELAVVAPGGSDDPMKHRLETLGAGPFAVELRAAAGRGGDLDTELSCGARLKTI